MIFAGGSSAHCTQRASASFSLTVHEHSIISGAGRVRMSTMLTLIAFFEDNIHSGQMQTFIIGIVIVITNFPPKDAKHQVAR